MMRRLAICAAAALLAGAASTASAAVPHTNVRVALSPQGRFPQRQFTVELPDGVKSYDLRVTENGVPVVPHLTPISRNRVPVSLAILLDTSDSMHGRPLAAAGAAAQELISLKPTRSEVAVFGFARAPYLIHGFTTNAGAFSGALGNLTPSAGTTVWDAVTMASQLISSRPGAARVIVLLTDGRDTASKATAVSAAAAAHAARARVFAIGLPGANAEHAELQTLVSQTGGEFIQVRSLSDLGAVYAGLAARLNREFVLRYTSQLRGTGRPVDVRVAVGAMHADVRYTIPSIAPADVTSTSSWWHGRTAVVAISAAVGIIVLLCCYLLLRPKRVSPARSLRGYGVRGVAETPAQPVLPDRPRRAGPRPSPTQVWARFAADVDRAELGRSPLVMLAAGMAIGTAVAAVAAIVAHQPAATLAGPVLGAVGAWAYVNHRASAWYFHFDSVLPDALSVLASSLRAGHSLLQAVDHVADEADDKTAREWGEVVRQTRLGIPVEDALDEMCHRVANKDLRWISLVARVQHQVGGNMAEMFDIVAHTVRERHRLRAQVRTLTAQGRMTRWILTLAPFGLGAVMMLVSPFYLQGFLGDITGRILLAMACVLVMIGSLWLKKIVEIEV
jgi:tight adherence protein B